MKWIAVILIASVLNFTPLLLTAADDQCLANSLLDRVSCLENKFLLPLGYGASSNNPALNCLDLKKRGAVSSGIYWIKPRGFQTPFKAFCEQEILGGGWTLLLNSVGSEQGNTLGFWNIPIKEVFKRKGEASIKNNYYEPMLYTCPGDYMDITEDLKGTVGLMIYAYSDGLDTRTMKFKKPTLYFGDIEVFKHQFTSGYSTPDFDNDEYVGVAVIKNCANHYNNVSQHYGNCWSYNLGSDAEMYHIDEGKLTKSDSKDGGWGPHVIYTVLQGLDLWWPDPELIPANKTDGGPIDAYIRVNRISRFVRISESKSCTVADANLSP